ncbi:MAG: aminotransferase class V-fold PLP-dependent enzyme [Veillonellales bacterium]
MHYFDNAATTVQKPQQVAQAVYDALNSQELGNPSRGAHGYSLNAYRKVLAAKCLVKELFQASSDYEVVFMHNSTTALNVVLKGILHPGDHVLTTVWEHNAVLRPLYQMRQQGLFLDFISGEPLTGALRYDEFEQRVRPETKMVVCNHASNVTGNVLDLDRIKKFCKKHGIFLVVDVSQSAGAYPVDLSDGVISAVCFTGHKSLYGPGGTGGVCLKKDLTVKPLITGGDGVHSFNREQPAGLPGVLEAGTANVTGIVGLAAGIRYILDKTVEQMLQKQSRLAQIFVRGARSIPNLTLYGDFTHPRVSVFSVNIGDADSAVVSEILWEEFHMATRSGFHCAPLMHEALQTERRGTVRFSFSSFTAEEDVRQAVEALKSIAKR